jgi:hypothetical protein
MTINKFLVACLILFFSLIKTDVNGQVQLGLFSYSELFYSPNKSYTDLKSFYNGYNKSNVSSHLGISIAYRINKRFNISLGFQRVNRQFNSDCISVFIGKSNFYYVGDNSCVLKSRSEDKMLQIPLSVKYLFPSRNTQFIHSIGLGNTIIYSLGRENLLYDDIGSLNISFDKKFISFFSPEIYYELDTRLSKRAFASFSFGIREEITKQFNHAFFGKVGIGYSIGKMPKEKRR